MSIQSRIAPELLKDIKLLSSKHNLRLYKKLLLENNILNFKGTLAECHFGLFFDQYCNQLHYDYNAFKNNLIPDWCFTINGQIIIAEVKSIIPSEDVHKREEKKNIVVEEFKKTNPDIVFIPEIKRIVHKPEKINSSNPKIGALVMKADAYGEQVEAKNMPYLICLAVDDATGLSELDLETTLYGYPQAPFQEPNGKCHTYFEQLQKNVSGVLLRMQNEMLYFHNHAKHNRLNEANYKWLNTFDFSKKTT